MDMVHDEVGLKLSGSGYFSSVYITECGTYAVKKANPKRAHLDVWPVYAAYICTLDNPAPWMPRIHNLRYNKGDNTFTCVMDAYEAQPQDSNAVTLCGNRYTIHNNRCAFKDEVVALADRLNSDLGFGSDDKYGLWFDGHVENFMLTKEGEAIATDPFCPIDWDDKELAGRISNLIETYAASSNKIEVYHE